MTDPTSAAVAAALKFATTTFPAAVGSFVSLRFMPNSMSKLDRALSVLSGYFLGSYFGRGLAEYLNISGGHVQDAIIFGVALFGISFVSNAMVELQPFLRALRRRFIGAASKEE